MNYLARTLSDLIEEHGWFKVVRALRRVAMASGDHESDNGTEEKAQAFYRLYEDLANVTPDEILARR